MLSGWMESSVTELEGTAEDAFDAGAVFSVATSGSFFSGVGAFSGATIADAGAAETVGCLIYRCCRLGC